MGYSSLWAIVVPCPWVTSNVDGKPGHAHNCFYKLVELSSCRIVLSMFHFLKTTPSWHAFQQSHGTPHASTPHAFQNNRIYNIIRLLCLIVRLVLLLLFNYSYFLSLKYQQLFSLASLLLLLLVLVLYTPTTTILVQMCLCGGYGSWQWQSKTRSCRQNGKIQTEKL